MSDISLETLNVVLIRAFIKKMSVVKSYTRQVIAHRIVIFYWTQALSPTQL